MKRRLKKVPLEKQVGNFFLLHDKEINETNIIGCDKVTNV